MRIQAPGEDRGGEAGGASPDDGDVAGVRNLWNQQWRQIRRLPRIGRPHVCCQFTIRNQSTSKNRIVATRDSELVGIFHRSPQALHLITTVCRSFR